MTTRCCALLRLRIILLTAAILARCNNAFTFHDIKKKPLSRIRNDHHHYQLHRIIRPTTIVLSSKEEGARRNNDNDDIADIVNTIETTYETIISADKNDHDCTTSSSSSLHSSSLRRRILRRLFRKRDEEPTTSRRYRFKYDYDEMIIGNPASSAETSLSGGTSSSTTTTAVMLIHPIGVGIGKWYYHRLLRALHRRYFDVGHRLVFLSPDLLGSATASGPTTTTAITTTAAVDDNAKRNNSVDTKLPLPLLNITDWTEQLAYLMGEYETRSERNGHVIDRWAVVANGGCSPIALQLASLPLSYQKQKEAASSSSFSPSMMFQAALTNVIISSPPRLPFFLESTDPVKVRKSYRTLSGLPGKLFWWYALRNDGKFVQTFSEKNLVGDPANLGEEWTPNCLEAARLHGGKSRYSTFAFLAGTLQDGCRESLDVLAGSDVTIDFIRGMDKRRNRARSWFWTRRRRSNDTEKEAANNNRVSSESEEQATATGTTTNANDDAETTTIDEEETIQQYVCDNGNRGKELFVGGRISLAWEDSDGYAKSLMKLLCE